jgi:hypothetical protein
VGVAESILKAALFVLVASTGEKLTAGRRTGRGATSTRLSSVALKLMSERERERQKTKDERYLRVTGNLGANRVEEVKVG